MKEKLLGAVIGLARATENNEDLITNKTHKILTEGLIASLPESKYSENDLVILYAKIMAEKERIIPSCFTCAFPCGRTDNYDMKELWNMEKSLREKKLKLLLGIQYLAMNEDRTEETTLYLYKALILFGIYWDEDGMIPILDELEMMIQKNR